MKNAISQVKSWRSLGLPAKVALRKLFMGKILPRFSYAFALLNVPKWGPTQDLIREVLDTALSRTCAFNLKPKDRQYPGIWTAICGFPPVESFLRQEKLLMAARLVVGEYKAARMFRGLFKDDHGSFENDVTNALCEWSLANIWKDLSKDNLLKFKHKVKSLAKKQWPSSLGKVGQLRWLYHNHQCYSGNVPGWADWVWPKKKTSQEFEHHFVYLLTGLHPAWGDNPACCYTLCGTHACDSLYNHHFFKCPIHIENRSFFRESARHLFKEKDPFFATILPSSILEAVLINPCPMWVGLLDESLFKTGIKLCAIHELHRIVTMASIFSWGRFYDLP